MPGQILPLRGIMRTVPLGNDTHRPPEETDVECRVAAARRDFDRDPGFAIATLSERSTSR
jgi:hypothetical protein